MRTRVPDLVLVPALLSPQDDVALSDALRTASGTTPVPVLISPLLSTRHDESARGALMSKWRRKGSAPGPSDGCDPAIFAEQMAGYLTEAASHQRAESIGVTPDDLFEVEQSPAPPQLDPFPSIAPVIEHAE